MKLGKNQCVKDNAVSEQTFTSASHESPDNIVSEKDASRAGVYGFAILMFALGFCVVFALTLPFLSPYTVLACFERHGFAPALRLVDGCSVLVGGVCLRFCIVGVALYSAPCFVVS